MQEKRTTSEFTTEQKELWEHVENYTRLIINNDTEGFLKYYHDNYTGLNYEAFLPIKKSDIMNELLHLPKRKVNTYEIFPLTINIFNETAVVQYSFSIEYENSLGEVKAKTGYNTDVLLKQGDKWLIIADHVKDNKVVKNSNH